ncbi:hypothetical protein MKW98_010450 [Papaver atlanticum]|uniref:Salutaridinol 7-O-acetyltransferase n=1 Tax=Papaver atlanticum TaxID=357466 RepID=A0AAD4XUI8_9MAGN|nr:hypothetical protein MKW98_010450 [Papaver atlanticum]
MKVEIVSKEIIKPSSPIPHHLRNFKLSLLDQLLPPLYVPIVIFYSNDDDHPFSSHGSQCTKSDILKKSLSETLTKFYPIAGRIKDNILVDCTNEGVDYIETKVNGLMSDFMSVDVVHQLSPSHILADINGAAEQAQLVVQVNMFECGGVAISVCLSHKVVDACTAMTFLNAWAANARGVHAEGIVYPTFDSSSIFPALPMERQVPPFEPDDAVKGENVITKRFIFHAAGVSSLREKIAASRSGSSVFSKYPTRVEAISALIWKTFMDIDRVKMRLSSPPSTKTPVTLKSLLNFAVNLRTRLDPPLPQASFGNVIMDATAESMTTATTNDDDESSKDFAKTLDGLVGQLREAVNEINGDYIRKLKDGDTDFLKSIGNSSHLRNISAGGDDDGGIKVQVCWISSLSRFPFYETDFGWGKPCWIACNTTGEYKNSLLIMDTKCGTGIEAWVSLEEEDMSIFEENHQLLHYAKT